jgi:hypothetical protein
MENKRYSVHLVIVDNECKLPNIKKENNFIITPGTIRFEDNLDDIKIINLDRHKERIVKYFEKIKNDEKRI